MQALLRYVDDDADCLRAVAAEPQLFDVQLVFFASWVGLLALALSP